MTIGLYVTNLDEEFHLSLFRGARDYCERMGIELMCIQGDSIDWYIKSGDTCFSVNRVLPVDGVIILSSTLIEGKNRVRIPELDTAFTTMPVVSAGSRLNDYPAIRVKTRKPMDELMSHLLEDHGYRRFLYIGGPVHNRDNRIRESSFTEALKKAGRSKEGIHGEIRNGDLFVENAGFSIMGEYIRHHPEKDLDVIVAGSDNIAIGVLKALHQHRGSGWESCALTGFDDIPHARNLDPPLTTIHQPVKEMGFLAAEKVHRLLERRETPWLQHVNAQLCIRSSCGCSAQTGTEEPEQKRHTKTETLLRDTNIAGQELGRTNTLEEALAAFARFLATAAIERCILIPFIDRTEEYPVTRTDMYQWNANDMKFTLVACQQTFLKDGLKDLLQQWNDDTAVTVVYQLRSLRIKLGLLLYRCDEELYPYMCSCGSFLSNALIRIQTSRIDAQRARMLEEEVRKRTEELIHEAEQRRKTEAEVLRISDKERLRFSMDLHDDICQRLGGLAMLCKGMEHIDPRIREASSIAVETLKRTRAYAHDSFPMKLGDHGLKESLSHLCRETSELHGIAITFTWNGEQFKAHLPGEELNIYRIMQEALTNAVKHAQASHIQVSASVSDQASLFSVSDDGRGIPAAGQTGKRKQIRRPEGIGLASMTYRANQMGAKLVLRDRDGGGTVVELAIHGN